MMVLPFETQEQSPLATVLGDDPLDAPGNFPSSGIAQSAMGNDLVSRFMPPSDSGSPIAGFGANAFSQLANLFTQIGQLISQLFGGGLPSGGASGTPDRFFGQASGASVGDPHLSFNENTWNDMNSQSDLLDSDSFAGGFQISTQATQPNQNGITYNEQATISSNYGLNSVTLDRNGNATVLQNGEQVAISRGQSIDLGNGESVTSNADGSLQVLANDGMGGSITTTLRANGNGVDVTSSAQNVDLGGALVMGPGEQFSPQPPTTPMPAPPPNGWAPIGRFPQPIRMNAERALFDERARAIR